MSQKAKNLEILSAAGIVVPKGFALPAEHYQHAAGMLTDDIEEALPDAQKVEAIFKAMVLPSQTAQFIDMHLARLSGASRFAVRSSGAIAIGSGAEAVLEDSAETSLAGQFDSFLNVPVDMVGDAVKRCWASLFNARSISSFCNRRGYVRSSTMTVVIQEMITAKASAVMMTADPLGDGSTGAIEFTWGPCGAIVAGITSPDEAIFDRFTGCLLSIRLGRKERRIAYSDYGYAASNETKVVTTIKEQRIMSLESATLTRLIDLGAKIEQIFGRPQDIEAVVTDNNSIVVTQARPVTMLSDAYFPFNTSMAA
jgi:rifampicin phosphotransferase